MSTDLLPKISIDVLLNKLTFSISKLILSHALPIQQDNKIFSIQYRWQQKTRRVGRDGDTVVESKHVYRRFPRRSHADMKTNTKNIRNKNREKNESGEKKQREKKPFDKKKYRLQKYSNKHKSESTSCMYIIQVTLVQICFLINIYSYAVNQWEERRKKAVLREFHKELKRNQQNSQTSTDLNDILESTDETRYMKD